MPHVYRPNGKHIGEIRDPSLLAYYRGEGYRIVDEPLQPLAAATRAATEANAELGDATDELTEAVTQTPDPDEEPENESTQPTEESES